MVKLWLCAVLAADANATHNAITRMIILCTSHWLRLCLIPPVAILLLLVRFLKPVHNLLASQTAHACGYEVDQGKRSDIASCERQTAYWDNEEFMRETGQWRQHGVRYADAVGAVFSRSLNSLDGHTKPTTKAYADDNVALGG